MFLFSLDKNPEVELLDHVVVLFLIFWGTFTLFSIVAAPIYITTRSAQVSLFSTSSPTLVTCGLFDGSHSDRCEVVSHCVFVFSDIYRGVELLGHMVVLFLGFWETFILFSTAVTPIYIPTNSVWGFSVGFIFKPLVGWLDEFPVSHTDPTTTCDFLDIYLTHFLSLARIGSHGTC